MSHLVSTNNADANPEQHKVRPTHRPCPTQGAKGEGGVRVLPLCVSSCHLFLSSRQCTTRSGSLCRCGNAETQIFALIDRFNVDTGSFNATVLAGYYLKAEGGSFNAIVQSATGVNFAGMQSTINQTIGSAVTVSLLRVCMLHVASAHVCC